MLHTECFKKIVHTQTLLLYSFEQKRTKTKTKINQSKQSNWISLWTISKVYWDQKRNTERLRIIGHLNTLDQISELLLLLLLIETNIGYNDENNPISNILFDKRRFFFFCYHSILIESDWRIVAKEFWKDLEIFSTIKIPSKWIG